MPAGPPFPVSPSLPPRWRPEFPPESSPMNLETTCSPTQPGTYTVSCEAAGFRKAEVSRVLVEVNQRGRVDLAMQVGEVREVVAVQANVTTVDTFSSTVKEVVDSGRIRELPLNGRQTLQLQALLPGAVNVPSGSAASLIAINTG